MVRKQVLRVREHSRESLFEKVKSESDQMKLIFNITYYPFFSKCKKQLQAFIHALLLTAIFRQRFIFFTVNLVKYLHEVLPWWTPK